MNRFTPLILLVVVAVLGYVAYRQTERENLNPLATVGPLFEGVEARRVTAIRLENIRAARHMRFQRDAGGNWFLTDPIAWSVEPGLMDKILQVVTRNQADTVPEVLAEEARGSFQPPRGFLETEELLEGGERRLTRVEIGEPDLDGIRVYVRREGQVMRTARNMESLFDLALNDYRDKRLFTIPPAGIASIERIGGWYEDGSDERLGMTASPYGFGWRIHQPVGVLGDPTLFGLWTRFLGSVRARRFVSDRPDEDLSRYNLDQPWVTLRLTSAGGATQSLHFSGKDGRVYAMRDDALNVFELDAQTGLRLREPLENFYEGAFVRVTRDDIRRIWIKGLDATLRLTRSAEGWTIARQPAGTADYSMDVPADEQLVADFLTSAEAAEVVRYFTDVEPEDFFSESATTRALWIEPSDGRRRGGSFAEAVTTPEGTRLVPFLRDGDTVVGSVDPAVAELCGAEFEDFLDRSLWALENVRMKALFIGNGDVAREFQRSQKHDWRPLDADVPARELDPVLDYLLFLRAERHVPEGERQPLLEPVTVKFIDGAGTEHEARIGRVAEPYGDAPGGLESEGQVQVEVGPLRAVLKFPDLYTDLRAIVGA